MGGVGNNAFEFELQCIRACSFKKLEFPKWTNKMGTRENFKDIAKLTVNQFDCR